MADVTAQRAAIAETRARIDARLEELGQHVPDRGDLQATLTRYGAAAAGVVVGVVVLVVVTRSRLGKRRARSEARTYAKTLLKALPEVAEAWLVHEARVPAPVPSRGDRKLERKDLAKRQRLEERHAQRLAVIQGGGVPNPPRGGVGAAVLMAVGVVGGTAIAQQLGAQRSAS